MLLSTKPDNIIEVLLETQVTYIFVVRVLGVCVVGGGGSLCVCVCVLRMTNE